MRSCQFLMCPANMRDILLCGVANDRPLIDGLIHCGAKHLHQVHSLSELGTVRYRFSHAGASATKTNGHSVPLCARRNFRDDGSTGSLEAFFFERRGKKLKRRGGMVGVTAIDRCLFPQQAFSKPRDTPLKVTHGLANRVGGNLVDFKCHRTSECVVDLQGIGDARKLACVLLFRLMV